MSRRQQAEEWPYNVTVVCGRCARRLLRYRAWRDVDEDVGPVGEERWEPEDATLTTSAGGAKFSFICGCGARPQIRYDRVAEAATPYAQTLLEI